ncbi:acetate--CoA ligase [SAR92 clade bacterium H455]|uniref:Acetyl-coenzyme A synthetase n=1 Tax=SAR92 clade bacterium H455 TaxID=2974818 RepID=A0ABY5TMK3_9GAMM|nr:acetate--CoA ligase [SAR92 clade bacterium H455]
MSDSPTHPIPQQWSDSAWIDEATYKAMYRQSVDNPEQFWGDQAAQFLTWEKPWETVCRSDIEQGQAAWFEGGKLNVAVNCIDRHLVDRADQTAIIWEGDDPSDHAHISYAQLHEQVSRLGNVLRQRGVKKGDRVCIYMPMIPEAAYAMLACARIGAVHSVVFGGFSPEALKDRILDSDCQVVITADEGLRAGKAIPLKANTDRALANCPDVHTCLVVRRTGGTIDWQQSRDIWYQESMESVAQDCAPETMDAEDPLFILYTSGSTGKPKGVVHSTGGYLLMAAMTHKYTFDYKDGDVFWCTADVGWVTGHSYILYGPLCNGAITLMFEGVPTYPDASRFWQVIDKHKVNQFYTAPTAIRSLMACGDSFVKSSSRSSLKLLGTVGEPINPEAWDWYHRVVGESRCPIVDTWWQTETGAHMLTPLPGATALKPGSATKPFFGVQPVLLDAESREIDGPGEGLLMIKASWPSQIRTIYGDHQRFVETYFRPYAGYYFTGDGARRDEDGCYWITGRVDDVLNISGHRMGTAEVESALVLHEKIAEAAVVGYPHDVKGQGIYCYVTPMNGVDPDEELRLELIALCVKEIGPIAKPDIIQWAPGLPKTRSGKIMRRILRKVAASELDSLGDTSTLADPAVVDELIASRKNR